MQLRRPRVIVSFLLCISALAASAQQTTDTALLTAARNISTPGANFFLYHTFSREELAFRPGDLLEYDIYIAENSPEPKGGIDIDVTGPGPIENLRDSKSTDQNGLLAHGDAILTSALGQWHTRRIPLDKLAGKASTRWNLQFEGDAAGEYFQLIDNVRVRHSGGKTTVIYDDGAPPVDETASREGYSQAVALVPVERNAITDGRDLDQVVRPKLRQLELRQRAESIQKEIEAIGELAARDAQRHMAAHGEALESLARLQTDDTLTSEKLDQTLREVEQQLKALHPAMSAWTGHLIGHAHIDFQWLWEWPETLEVCRDTFGQAVKFMSEYPGFTFNQSSSALYDATEQEWPEIFAKIKEFVEKGQWEISGGRVCEGDTHTISAESHARHFLYGQRYFRERFDGRQAVVGWEPDTFGHTWTMPQILQLGGCRYYYFCRGGFGHPLFWWEGPDGARVLAFEESYSGSWYNSDLSPRQFQELADFKKKTGSKEMLWVYGVGNHGGGPTREHLETARGWQSRPYLPTVKFSTATAFFQNLEKLDLSNIPVVKTELNTTSSSGFFGCYTSHSDIKRWNRDAEALTESAEAIAAFAAQLGFDYPRAEFRRNWEDITWNHHHDTLPGTSIHPSYDKSERMYDRVIRSSRRIGEAALAHIARLVDGQSSGVIVFNPVGWERSGLAQIALPDDLRGDSLVAMHPDGTSASLQELPGTPGKWLLHAENIPAFGYARYTVHRTETPFESAISVRDDGATLENNRFVVKIDPTRGVVTSIFDKETRREAILPGGSGNRLEVHWEAPDGMSAWRIGEIRKVEALEGPVDLEILERGPVRASVRFTRRFQQTDLVQTISLSANGYPEFSLDTKWNEFGSAETDNPFLKVAFDINVTSPTQTYEIPFGTIERPADGTEYPSLKWVDSSGGGYGAALLNDCKHGYSATGNTLWLSLIRSSYYPDPNPNERPQFARWAFVPHAGDWREARVLQSAMEFNRPFWTHASDGVDSPEATLAQAASFLQVGPENLIITGVKQAEDDASLVVRFHEAYGKAAEMLLKSRFASGSVQELNFLEDVLREKSEAAIRPYEIRTLKLEKPIP